MLTEKQEYHRKWRELNKQKCLEYSRQWTEKNKEKRREISRRAKEKVRKEAPDRLRNINYKYIYGITLEEYEQMLEGQKGVCFICNKPEISKDRKGNIKKLSVDHCHITKKVRKLLCFRCNSNLGKYEKYKSWAENYLDIFKNLNFE